ncbi:hypothetical protein B9Z55_020967 [Caenorhabditis nigoni]|nr:hypothetical protein B9Z55_020967 [Caenorhabditis nigoni]
MSNRRPFSELNEYSIPDLERRIIVAALHNELDLADFLNELEPLVEEVDLNDGGDALLEVMSDSNDSDSLELEQDEGEQQQEEQEDVDDQEEAEKENGEPIC